ncbi:lipase/esterase family protein [Aspergillus aculeatinus CBS 121060]|uniref:Lipase/esterase family protein n=1 Tax=Aspergillus aculeatinus CBS 121060 TaxID=1448322 RepID=A0ACD1H0Z9_9EURO|nr:lipase/esterase family protein [Aspergillus aculeatinus CBS 121060]RAH67243.1 lipase/esterase family protein [Aspergillus aculeatinus CBS 121060]
MPLNTFALSLALTPTVLQTLISHYLHRKSLHHKPNVHISYDESIRILREFLIYASKHSLEDLQTFTCQRVPAPHWVKLETVTVPEDCLLGAADAINKQLGPKGVARVGGKEWWQWRGPAEDLKAEWIEMKEDYNERKRTDRDHPSQKRIMLYIHGGAYFFGSLDTHRYQMQRHARKLKGRVFARVHPRIKLIPCLAKYRLAPQFPFPCGMQDSLAAYLFLLKEHKPEEILFAGDSAGGGLVLSMLVLLRDQGLPLPAGAILISPWVDLTHSFPSIVKDNPGDYIPPYGFMHKPSPAWPPPNADELASLKKALQVNPAKSSHAVPEQSNRDEETAERGYSMHKSSSSEADRTNSDRQSTEIHNEKISIPIDGETVEIKDQIHMYATNDFLTHPLVSPIFQPSLGGLPPLLIQSGGGEMLRDEQFYVAHKAANPAAYPPGDAFLDEHDPNRETLHKYQGTYVQLQVWDDLCHVAPTLSFTHPAKYMYRAIAQFGAWALACAQDTEVEIVDDHGVSSDTDSSEDPTKRESENSHTPVDCIGKAGDPLPAFKDRMIRQRVDKKGNVYPLDPPSACSVLQIPPSKVGVFNPVLVRKWLSAKKEWDTRFAKEKLRVQRQRMKELAYGLQNFQGELPPPSSLAARRTVPRVLPSRTGGKSYPMTMWSKMASKHDERTVVKEQLKGDRSTRTSVDAGQAGASMKAEAAQQTDENASATQRAAAVTGASVQDFSNKAQSNGLSNGGGSSGTKVPSEEDDDTRDQSANSHTKAPSLESFTPMLVLPGYEGKNFEEENASTRALFHEAGAIPTTGDSHWASRLRHRASSNAGSGTIRSGLTTEPPEDTSTIGDEKSLAVTTTNGLDAASTRAVLNAKGVLGMASDNESAYRSFEALPSELGDGEVGTPGLGPDGHEAESTPRPGLPDRDYFKTAEEYVAH